MHVCAHVAADLQCPPSVWDPSEEAECMAEAQLVRGSAWLRRVAVGHDVTKLDVAARRAPSKARKHVLQGTHVDVDRGHALRVEGQATRQGPTSHVWGNAAKVDCVHDAGRQAGRQAGRWAVSSSSGAARTAAQGRRRGVAWRGGIAVCQWQRWHAPSRQAPHALQCHWQWKGCFSLQSFWRQPVLAGCVNITATSIWSRSSAVSLLNTRQCGLPSPPCSARHLSTTTSFTSSFCASSRTDTRPDTRPWASTTRNTRMSTRTRMSVDMRRTRTWQRVPGKGGRGCTRT